ncbi:MAG TPA: Lrp/AsnC family transcriptional regulator [Rhizobiales bacterium]|nr:Lrp/AsnC family transcriptional regulator [Hyphomicrobiales bacterium]
MDAIDRRILSHLQNDSSIPLSELAKKVHLSKTPCWRRIQKMEKSGVICRRVALVDPAKVGQGLAVFVYIRANKHNAQWLAEFARTVSGFPEVIEFYRLSGEWDYFIRVAVSDISAYDRFYKNLVENAGLENVTSSFGMEEIKYTTAIPLNEDAFTGAKPP